MAREASVQSTKRNNLLKLTGLTLVLIGLFLMSRLLPVGEWLSDFNRWVGELGIAGVVIFAGLYAVATVLMLPGVIFSLGAGFAFGLGWGFAAVVVGATTGAALAFLIGRFLARDKIEAMTRDQPKFRALDRAIGKRGARLIFLLRLSPLIPFNLSNFFYGLTAVRFWPYVFASGIGMMPGILVYVYLGTLGRAGLKTAAGAETGRTPLEWALLVVGLIATVTVTVTIWISKIARHALREAEEIPVEKNDTPEEGWTRERAANN